MLIGFSSLQDVACHQPKALVAEIESRQWCGELHLGRFEGRILLVKVLCCAFFPGQDGKLFLWHICFISSEKMHIHATRIHVVFFASGRCQPPAKGAGGYD